MGKILIADDSKVFRSIIKVILKDLDFGNYQIVEVEDGQAALKALRVYVFDLILTDFEMPNLDGFELCKTILADRVLSKIPIIVISAMSNFQRDEFIKLGIKRVLFKPMQKNQLEVHLRELFPHVFGIIPT